MDGATNAWLDGELAGCSLADERLTKRLRKLLAQIGSDMGQSIPLVCQDWRFSPATRMPFRRVPAALLSESCA